MADILNNNAATSGAGGNFDWKVDGGIFWAVNGQLFLSTQRNVQWVESVTGAKCKNFSAFILENPRIQKMRTSVDNKAQN